MRYLFKAVAYPLLALEFIIETFLSMADGGRH
jgi:hypothetical protein